MKASDQITIVEPRIRTPAWRSASPKKRKTRRPKTSPKSRAANLAMSPSEAIQSRGVVSRRCIYLITEISGWVASSVWVKT
jgi:hypothetical protein